MRLKFSYFVKNQSMKIFLFPCSIGVRAQNGNRAALAVIDERGLKRIRSGRTKIKVLAQKIPIISGICYFFAAIFALFCAFWDSCKLSEKPLNSVSNKISNKLNIKRESVVITLLLSVSAVISLFLLGYIPSKMYSVFIEMNTDFALRNFLIALIKIAIIFLILMILRFLPMTQDLYKFNGACNQVQRRGGSSISKTKFDHHGTFNALNIIIFTFILSVFVITCVGARIAWHWNMLINVGLFFTCMAVAYEICYYFDKWKVTRAIGIITDCFVSAKPNITHDEVARIAWTEVKMFSKEDDVKDKENSLSSLLVEMQTILERAGKYEKSDVEWIIATVLGVSRPEAKLVKVFSPKQYRDIIKATYARAAGKPLSSIFGFVEFYGLRFDVSKKVLSPRMETEILVEQVAKAAQNDKISILDIGTGSGAIAVTLAKITNASVTAVDISKQALVVAKSNAEKNEVKVEFLQSDLFSRLKKSRKFDIIVSNPPYIRSLDIAGLDEEVKNYDPKLSLDGGEDGLDFYRRICQEAPLHLKNGGQIFFEIGKGQFKDVSKILQQNGFSEIASKKDYSNIIRVVRAKYDKRK